MNSYRYKSPTKRKSCNSCNRFTVIPPLSSFSPLRSSLKSPKRSPLFTGGKNNIRGNVRIPLKKGLLTKYGYSISNPDSLRQISLASAVSEYGPLSVFRKLNALMVLNMNNHPKMSQKYKKDRNWVRSTFM